MANLEEDYRRRISTPDNLSQPSRGSKRILARPLAPAHPRQPCPGRYFAPVLVLVFALLFSSGVHAEINRKISLTFDDLPVLGPLGFWRPREVSNMILRTMDRYDIKAAGFVVEQRVEKDLSTIVVLEDWIERDHILGNNTFGHVDLHQLERRDFLEHVKDGQIFLAKLARLKRFNFKYLRFPYLHEGETLKKKKRIAKSLYNGGYQIAPVTIKMPDLRFNRLYLKVQDDGEPRSRLKKIYLDELRKAVEYGEKQSQAVFGRNIPHILWLRCTIATAGFLEDLIEELKARGYSFVSFPNALSDPAYKTVEKYAGALGLSFIDRVAATRGLPFDPQHGELREREIQRRMKVE